MEWLGLHRYEIVMWLAVIILVLTVWVLFKTVFAKKDSAKNYSSWIGQVSMLVILACTSIISEKGDLSIEKIAYKFGGHIIFSMTIVLLVIIMTFITRKSKTE